MRLSDADAWIRHQVCAGQHWSRMERLGVAVSGGGDSVALLHLLAACAPEHGVTLEAATVDHGLRPEAAMEAAFVAEICAGLGIPHVILRWEGWDGRGNLQARARAARYRLLAGWARDRALDTVALAHTLDDQAETFLMRLSREAGVDGLAAMDTLFERDGARFWRPTLALERAELRAFLSRHGLSWHDDPSNEDERFDRVRARKALTVLEGLGIDKVALRGVAINLAAASTTLKGLAHDTARRIARVEAGDVVFDRRALVAAGPETMRRLLVAALNWVSGAPYAPRREAVADLNRAILGQRVHALHGCIVTTRRDVVRVTREHEAVKDLVAAPDAVWDGRWRLNGPGEEGLEIRALGEAVKDCPGWRETGLPRRSLLASPAIWDGDTLVAAPVAGLANGWSAKTDRFAEEFLTSILSH